MKASRLLSILMLLQAHGRMSAGALARAMEVSERTILRDIDQLSAAGVPIWGERGRLGGFQLRPGWSTQLTGMTEPEAQALLLSGLPTAAAELGLAEPAASARLKLVASLPPAWREEAARVGERLHVDPVDWYRAPDTPRFLREAAQAVWRAHGLRVRYESWRGVSRRELQPLGLVLKAGAWYLVAQLAREVAQASRATEAPRLLTYRLASMLELEDNGRPFRRPRAFDLAAYWQASAARFEAERQPLQARVCVSPRAMNWLVHSRARHVPVASGERGRARRRGWQEVQLALESVEQGVRHLLAYGDEVEVLAPPELRAELVRTARRLLGYYR